MESVYAFGLSVSACSYSRKYSSNVLKFIDAINIWNRMKRIENVMYGVKGSSTEAHKSFPIHYGA